MIKAVTYFQATCDNCLEEWRDDHNGFTAYADAGQMKEVLSDWNWHEENNKHYCEDCWSWDDDDNLVLSEERKKVKPECPDKVNGVCPHHNIHCRFPECEKDL